MENKKKIIFPFIKKKYLCEYCLEKDAEIKKLKEKIKELREDCFAGEGLVVEQIALNKKLKEATNNFLKDWGDCCMWWLELQEENERLCKEIKTLKAGEIENHNDTKYMSIKDNGKEHKVGE
jgi:hypothetical protein